MFQISILDFTGWYLANFWLIYSNNRFPYWAQDTVNYRTFYARHLYTTALNSGNDLAKKKRTCLIPLKKVNYTRVHVAWAPSISATRRQTLNTVHFLPFTFNA
jgi:hypothetical protein